MHIHCVRAHDLFAGLQFDRATTTGRLLGPITCLPHKDEEIPLSVLPTDTTSKFAGLFSKLPFCAERQAIKLYISFFM